VATQFFSAAEVRKLESWPVEFGRDELGQYFTLTPEDVAWVNKSARGTPAKLGLAVQLCALPWLGFVPDDVPAAPRAAVSRLAVQLGVPVGALASYGARAQTRTDHLRLAAQRLGWRTAEANGRAGWKRLREFPASPEVPAHLSPALMEHVNPYGTYTFPIDEVRDLVGYRPLRQAELTGLATA
jgi:hypothetical protein